MLLYLTENEFFFFLREAFCGLEYPENALAARALPRTPLGKLTTLPILPSRLGRGHPSPDRTQIGAFGASTLRSAPVDIVSGYATDSTKMDMIQN